MRTPVAILVSALLGLGGAASSGAASGEAGQAGQGAARDVRLLGSQLEAIHPDLFRHVSKRRFRTEVETLARRAPRLTPNQLLVGLMRLAALPGPRNGHTGLFPLHPHRRPLHLYPVRLYEFADGLHVVDAAGDRGPVGAKLVAIAGVPIEHVLARVAPLVPRDNAFGLRAWAPHVALVAEVLDGLGLVQGLGPVTLTFERAGGERFEQTLAPIPGAEYASVFADGLHGHYPALLPRRARPLYLANSGRQLYLRTLAAGRALYVGYNATVVPTDAFAERLGRIAREKRARRVIVDVRLNGGGNNMTYRALLRTLAAQPVNRRGRLFLLIGRATFSAAGNFATEVDRYTRALLVGEPTGGGVNQYGDATTVALPATGWDVHVATEYVARGEPGDRRLAVHPDRRVDLRAADYFEGRDPVLEAALAGL
jgi:hypothetical protein